MASLRGMNVPPARVSPPTGLSLRGPGALLSERVSRGRLLCTRSAISSRELRLTVPCGSLQVKGSQGCLLLGNAAGAAQSRAGGSVTGLPAAKVAGTFPPALNRQQALTSGSTAMQFRLSSTILCCKGSLCWQAALQCAPWPWCRAGQDCGRRSAVWPLAASAGPAALGWTSGGTAVAGSC